MPVTLTPEDYAEQARSAERHAGWCLWRSFRQPGTKHWRMEYPEGVFALLGADLDAGLQDEGAILRWCHPDDCKSLFETFAHIIRTGELRAFRFRIIRPDGSIRHVFSRGWGVDCPQNGRFIQGFHLDVTGEFVDEKLIERERSLSFLTENTSEMLMRSCPNGKVQFVSNACFGALGYRPDEMCGRSILDFVVKEDVAALLPLLRGHAAKGISAVKPIEYRMRNKQGEIVWVEAAPRAVFDGAGNLIGWADVIRDIAQRKRLEEEARIERAAREAADNANMAKTQFLANMSHELRTPLNAIIGFAELIQEDPCSSQTDAGRIERSAKHLLHLINQVLDMGKVEAGMLEALITPTDVPALLQDVVDTLGPAARANHNVLELHVGPDVGVILTDGRLLKQCLLNLGSNACKFTRDGVVHLEAVFESTGEGRILAFRVIDTGIGISAEAMQRLFQPFVQADPGTSRQYGGTGLGLVLTRRFAQLLGGDAWVDSKIGVGSTFSMTIRDQTPARRAA